MDFNSHDLLNTLACSKAEFVTESVGGNNAIVPEIPGGGDGDGNGKKDDRTPVDDGINDPDVLDQYSCVNDEGENGVEICHIPQGNPAALHTICIGKPAVRAHMRLHHADTGEHDYLGKCGASAPTEEE